MLMFLLLCSVSVLADNSSYLDDSSDYNEGELSEVFDPVEPINRFFFGFNDLIHKVLLKPVSKVYGTILPEDIRQIIDNAWVNLKAPIRIVNNTLQGDIDGTGREIARFLINSTIGVIGLGDPAKTEFGIEKSNEDFGQTLAWWGIGNGFYLVLPIIGPTTLRDGIGLAGDAILNPHNYIYTNKIASVLYLENTINNISLNDPYSDIVEDTFDPYVALRDAYIQYRNGQIER